MRRWTKGSLMAAACLAITACCDESSIPRLDRALYSGTARERNDAALGLARCGSAAEGSVSRLAQLLYDENVGVQSSAAYALRRIGTKEAQRALERAEARRRENRRR